MEKLLSPFVGYWYWAQERATPASKALALGAPLVAFGLVLFLLFGRGGDGSPATPEPTQGNIAVSTSPAGSDTPAAGTTPTGAATTPAAGTTPASETGATPAATGAESTPGAAPTAFTQERYTVVAGDSPSAIAEKVGVPANIRSDWVTEMLALNGVTATTLQVGQELILPPF